MFYASQHYTETKNKKNTENLKIAATITAATMAAAAAAAAKCNKQFAIKCAAAVKCSDARLIFHYFFGEWPDSHFAAIVFHKSTLTSCCSLYSLQLTAFFRLWAIIQLTRAGIRQISLTFFYFPARSRLSMFQLFVPFHNTSSFAFHSVLGITSTVLKGNIK